MKNRLGLEEAYFDEDGMGDLLTKKIDYVKRQYRPEHPLYMWHRRDYHQTSVLEDLAKQCQDNIQRIDYHATSVDEFRALFEKTDTPCIITGAADGWRLEEKWTWKSILEDFNGVRMRIAQTDFGKVYGLSIREYYKYMLNQKDDFPLYLFQTQFNELQGCADMLKRYEVPKYFKEDYFELLDKEDRPPYRWFLVGPKRSGTPMHIDPIQTSAWNTSLQGTKYWVMLPNKYPKSIVNGRNARNDYQESLEHSAIEYFVRLLPKIKQQEGGLPGMIECLQRPGETVFVPGGWWHAVLNLDDTMAVTQNFVNENNLDRVWRSMRYQRPDLCVDFMEALKSNVPQAYKRLLELNLEDHTPLTDAGRSIPFSLDISTDSNDSSSSGGSHAGDLKKADSEDEMEEDDAWADDDGDNPEDPELPWEDEDEEMESILLLNRDEVKYKKRSILRDIKEKKSKAAPIE